MRMVGLGAYSFRSVSTMLPARQLGIGGVGPHRCSGKREAGAARPRTPPLFRAPAQNGGRAPKSEYCEVGRTSPRTSHQGVSPKKFLGINLCADIAVV
jgi:hypothetical protein